jgi:hypothetical protein
MKKVLLAFSLLTSVACYSQEQTITMEMVPVYTIDVTETQINVVTTYPIDVYVDEVVYPISVPGFHTIKITANNSRILVLPHNQF